MAGIVLRLMLRLAVLRVCKISDGIPMASQSDLSTTSYATSIQSLLIFLAALVSIYYIVHKWGHFCI